MELYKSSKLLLMGKTILLIHKQQTVNFFQKINSFKSVRKAFFSSISLTSSVADPFHFDTDLTNYSVLRNSNKSVISFYFNIDFLVILVDFCMILS